MVVASATTHCTWSSVPPLPSSRRVVLPPANGLELSVPVNRFPQRRASPSAKPPAGRFAPLTPYGRPAKNVFGVPLAMGTVITLAPPLLDVGL
jgi:hypothetical protein